MRHPPKIGFVTICLMVSMACSALARAGEIRLRSLDGEVISLTQKKGKVIVLAFCATWVPQADKRLPAFQKLADLYSSRDAEFYWVSIDSKQAETRNYASDDELRVFAGQNGLQLKILRDPDLTAYDALGVVRVPTLIIIGRDGQIQSKHTDFATDRSDIYQEITRLLNRLVK